MATFLEIQTRAKGLVNGPAIEDIIPALINQGVNEIAGGMLSTLGDIITPPLPELFTIGTVTTSITEAFVNMPTNFQRTLQLAVKEGGSEVDIANSFIEFVETAPALDKPGAISEVIEHGKKLYYLNIPAASEDVTVHYYRAPIDMINDTDTPDGIPIHLQMSLLSNFAAWKANEYIEDGLEGETPNTLKYREFFMASLRTLELSIPDYTRTLELR